MRVSVAMCTYNGESYLQEQLDSFVRQSYRPHELIVCDDASTDSTADILRSFCTSAPFEVSVYENPKRVGYVRNFELAISRCRGDVIFLSDQDDVWFEKKIERHLEMFARAPESMAVINDAEITDAQLGTTGLTKIGQTRSSGSSPSNFVTGCCTSFRASLGDIIFPIPAEYVTHDSWINRIGDALGRRVVLEEVLQYIRRHDENTSNEISSGLSRAGLSRQMYRILRGNPFTYCIRRARRLECVERRLAERSESLKELLGRSEDADAVFRRLRAERSWDLKLYYALCTLWRGRARRV